MLGLGLAVRLCGIDQPPLDWHATRQYHSALLARALYLERDPDGPAWREELADLDVLREQGVYFIEPPLMEWAAALLYDAAGGEGLWLPRAVASLLWVLGGVALYAAARLVVVARPAAIVALAVYLFLPFAIVGSRTFQPESLLVATFATALWAVVRHHARPRRGTFGLLLAATALAVLVKPGVAFLPLLGAFAGLLLTSVPWRAFAARLALVAAVAVLPAAVYYLGLRLGDHPVSAAATSFDPGVLLASHFWMGWADNAVTQLGPLTLIGGAAAVGLAEKGLQRRLLLGLSLGYLAFGLVFAVHVSTHDYYQLLLVPIAALQLGVLVDRAGRWRTTAPQKAVLAALGVLAAVSAAAPFDDDLRTMVSGSDAAAHRVAAFERIGARVGHSRSVLFLDPDYGLPLSYHGWVSGRYWPRSADLRWERRYGGGAPVGVHDRFVGSHHWPSPATMPRPPEYFVVTDLADLTAQPGLRRYLTERFPVVEATGDFVVYDLRRVERPGVRASAAATT